MLGAGVPSKTERQDMKIHDHGQPSGQDDDRGPRKRATGKGGGDATVRLAAEGAAAEEQRRASPPESVASATTGPRRIVGGFGEEPDLASMGYDPQDWPKHSNK